MEDKNRRHFSREYKLEAVKRSYEGGQSASQVARELGIPIHRLYKWRDQLSKKGSDAFPGTGRTSPNDELEKLRKENKRLRMERDILKKSLSFLSKDTKIDSK